VSVDEEGSEAFAPIQRIGGAAGWYADNWFWRLRGLLDTLRGGVGLRRGRRDPEDLRVGDTVDFWRVERLESARLLLLAAEMKIPGRLWLQFEVDSRRDGSVVRQTTVFDPAGYVGFAYWYLLYPIHDRVFRRMLRGIQNAIQSGTRPRLRRRRGRFRSRAGWESGPRALVHVLPRRRAGGVPESGAVHSIQEAEVLIPRPELERLWRPETLELLAGSYWRFLARLFVGVIHVVHKRDSPTIVFLFSLFPLLHFRTPEYETDEDRGRATWRIERGLLVAKDGRGRGYLRLSVERLDRAIETHPATGLREPRAAVLVRVEVQNFYPWLRGTGRFARVGTWLYSRTQLRMHVLVCNAFLRSLAHLELPGPA